MSELSRKDWELDGSGRMTEKQRRMLNGVCGCLVQIHWHGAKLGKDSWRHLLSAVAAGQQMHTGWDYGDGRPCGFIVLGKSSLELSKTQAKDAITMGIQLGDDPESQRIEARPVVWSDAVLWGMGFNPKDLR